MFSNLNHGGWLSESSNVNCGINQFATALRLSCRNFGHKKLNSSIEGTELAKLKDLQISIKCRQLADDTFLFLKDKNGINSASNVIEEFYSFSGLKLNFHKTKLMKFGRHIQDDINISSEIEDKIKICLIYQDGINLNWQMFSGCLT